MEFRTPTHSKTSIVRCRFCPSGNVVEHSTKLKKWGLTFYRSEKKFILNEDGRTIRLEGVEYFAKTGIRMPKIIGGGQAKILETRVLTVSTAHPVEWKKYSLNLNELARLRWVEGWKIERLSVHFELSRTAIKDRLRGIESDPKQVTVSIPDNIIRGR